MHALCCVKNDPDMPYRKLVEYYVKNHGDMRNVDFYGTKSTDTKSTTSVIIPVSCKILFLLINILSLTQFFFMLGCASV